MRESYRHKSPGHSTLASPPLRPAVHLGARPNEPVIFVPRLPPPAGKLCQPQYTLLTLLTTHLPSLHAIPFRLLQRGKKSPYTPHDTNKLSHEHRLTHFWPASQCTRYVNCKKGEIREKQMRTTKGARQPTKLGFLGQQSNSSQVPEHTHLHTRSARRKSPTARLRTAPKTARIEHFEQQT
eukprot:scaffold2260_cov212-Pinguiococcus_pyrenoidosus.AAC.1